VSHALRADTRGRQSIVEICGCPIPEVQTNRRVDRRQDLQQDEDDAHDRKRFREAAACLHRSNQHTHRDSEERGQFVNALTTNLTSFFREGHHFEMLAEYGAARRRASPGGGRLRVWSSACSTGEEPYSAAIVLREAECPAEIVATDIDTEVLRRAQRGNYALDAVDNMNQERLRRYFLKGVGQNEGRILVRPELQAMVRFSQCNLQGDNWPTGDRFDVIFCRNVMIYFSRESQRQVLDRFIRVLRPGGLLFVGHSESYATGHAALRNCGKTAYERRADDSPRAP